MSKWERVVAFKEFKSKYQTPWSLIISATNLYRIYPHQCQSMSKRRSYSKPNKLQRQLKTWISVSFTKFLKEQNTLSERTTYQVAKKSTTTSLVPAFVCSVSNSESFAITRTFPAILISFKQKMKIADDDSWKMPLPVWNDSQDVIKPKRKNKKKLGNTLPIFFQSPI